MTLIYEVHAEKRSWIWLKNLSKSLGWDFDPADWWNTKSAFAYEDGFLMEFHHKFNTRQVGFEFHREDRRFVFFDNHALVGGGNSPDIYIRGLSGRNWFRPEDDLEPGESD